ncbi:unnamed protein product [Adineta steineri]|nr:unnamed protein product [Adineta steineri]
MWMQQRGKNEPNSNSIQSVDHGSTSVLVYATVFETSVDCTFAFLYSAYTVNECTSLGLIATQPENEPLVPSIIISTLQISGGTNTIPYAQLFSSKTQLGNSNSDVVVLDGSSAVNKLDITTAEKHGIIKYNEAGVYFLIACAQVGSAKDTDASGEVHLWMRLNEKDIANSNAIKTIRSGNTAVLVSQTVVKLEAEDKVQLVISTTNKELGLIASKPENEPLVPGIIFSTFRLSNNENPIAYAQLSSSQSQWGCTTPKTVKLDNNDGSHHIKNNNGVMEFEESGTYFVMAAAQVGSDEDNGIGDVRMWLRLNGEDMADSNTIQTVEKDTAVLVCQTAVELKSGDKLEVVLATDVTEGTLGVVATKPHKEAAVPSIIVSVFKSTGSTTNSQSTKPEKSNDKEHDYEIIDDVAYLQASSSKNQLTESSPKAITYNKVDGLNGYSTVENNTFLYETPGYYFIMFGAQVGSPSGNGQGEVHLWIRENGKDDPLSNSLQTVERRSLSVIVYTLLMKAPIGRDVTVMISADPSNKCSSLGLVAVDVKHEPLVPSIIRSEIQLSDIDHPVHNLFLSSAKTQLGSSNSKAITYDQDQFTGIGIPTAKSDGSIKFNESGIYFVIYIGQGGSAADTRASGEIYLGPQLNGKDIPHSNVIQSVRSGSDRVFACQSIVKAKADDKLRFVFSTTNDHIGLIATEPKNEPAVVSSVLTIFELGTKDNPVPYAQLSSSNSQWGCITPKKIELNTNDGSHLIKNNNGIIEFEEPGTYFVMGAGQVGSFEGKGNGDVHLWLRLNGKDVADSNTIQTVDGDTTVLVCQAVIKMEAGDKLELMFSADVAQGKLGFITSQPGSKETVPSMVFSAFKSSYSKTSEHHNKLTFGKAASYGPGDGERFVFVADFNHDNNKDIASLHYLDSTMDILLGKGDGKFEELISLFFGHDYYPLAMATGDLNKDNKLDIVVAFYGANKMGVFLGDGTGHFRKSEEYFTGKNSTPAGIILHDIDQDHILDIIVTCQSGDNVQIFLGEGDGSFHHHKTYSTGENSGPITSRTGDFDKDGKIDFFVTHFQNSMISVFLGEGNGDFSEQVTYPAPSHQYGATVYDFNYDGILDLGTNSDNINTINIYFGKEDGTFGPYKTLSTGTNTSPFDIQPADLNNDNIMDIVVPLNAANRLGVFLGNGDGSFKKIQTFSLGTGVNPYAVATGDFNNDGRIDVVTANNITGDASVLLNTSS